MLSCCTTANQPMSPSLCAEKAGSAPSSAPIIGAINSVYQSLTLGNRKKYWGLKIILFDLSLAY